MPRSDFMGFKKQASDLFKRENAFSYYDRPEVQKKLKQQQAKEAADVEIARKETRSQLATLTAAFKGQGEVDSMTKQMEQMQKAMGQDVAAPSAIPGGGGQGVGRQT